jgi:hypothetical protein
LRRPRTNAKTPLKIKSPAVSAGLFCAGNFRRAYLETRSFDSDVPIAVNAAAIWLDEATVESLALGGGLQRSEVVAERHELRRASIIGQARDLHEVVRHVTRTVDFDGCRGRAGGESGEKPGPSSMAAKRRSIFLSNPRGLINLVPDCRTGNRPLPGRGVTRLRRTGSGPIFVLPGRFDGVRSGRERRSGKLIRELNR